MKEIPGNNRPNWKRHFKKRTKVLKHCPTHTTRSVVVGRTCDQCGWKHTP